MAKAGCIEWKEPPIDLIEGISRADAVVLEARGGEEWSFRLRFPNHEKLSAFHNYIIEHGIPAHIDRTYTLSEATEHGHRFSGRYLTRVQNNGSEKYR